MNTVEKSKGETYTLSSEMLATLHRRVLSAEIIFLSLAIAHFGGSLFSVGGYAPQLGALIAYTTYPAFSLSLALYLWHLISRELALRSEKMLFLKFPLLLCLLAIVVIINLKKFFPHLLPF